MNTGQDGGHIIGWTPSILKNVQTELASAVDVWMKHLTDELDPRWLVRILFLKMHDEPEGAILKGGISGPNNNGVPLIGALVY